MNLTAHEGKTGEYWTTFYNQYYTFQADAKTQAFKVELSDDQLTMHEVEDGIVNKKTAVVLKSTSGNPVMTLTTSASSNTDGNNLYGVFDLQGRKVAQPTKGLYIVNGKKVVIK